MNENPIIPENEENKDKMVDNINSNEINIIDTKSEIVEPIIPEDDNITNLSNDLVSPEMKEETVNIISQNNNTVETINNSKLDEETSKFENDEISNLEIPTIDSNTILQTDITNPISNNIKASQGKTKKSKKGIIIALIIIILLAFVLAFGFFYLTNPKRILSNNLSKMYTNLLNFQEENKVLTNILNKQKVGMTSNIQIKLSDSQGITKDFSNIGLALDYREDKELKEGYLELDTTLTNKKFINLETVLKDNKVYIKLKNIMDKYYFTEYEFISILNNSNNEDFVYLLDIVKKNIINNFEKEELKTENVSEKINNKTEKLEKITLEIKQQLLNKISLESLEDIKNDDKAINIIIDNFKVSKEDLLNGIDKLIDELKASTTDELILTYSIYVKNYKDVLKQVISSGYTRVELYNYDNIKEIKYTKALITNCGIYETNCIPSENDEKSILELKIIGDKNSGKITGIINSTASITGKYTNNSMNLTFKDSSGSNEINLKLDYNNNKISNTEYQNDFNMAVSTIQNSTELLKVEINMDSKFTSDVQIPSINISDSTDVNLITQEEQNEIINKFMSIPVIQELIIKYSQIEVQ